MLTPTTAYNENYIAYRLDRWTAKQLPDHIIRIAGGAGKHVSLAALTDRTTGRQWVLGDTHLDPYASISVRAQQCVNANRATKAQADEHGSCPYILAGDFNYQYVFNEMKAIGRLDVGHVAVSTIGWKYATFIGTNSKLDLGPHIDYITIGKDARVALAEVVQIRNAAGTRYKEPLAGDHVPKRAIIRY